MKFLVSVIFWLKIWSVSGNFGSKFWLIWLVWFEAWLPNRIFFILTNRLPKRKPDFYFKPAELNRTRNQTNQNFWFGSVQDSASNAFHLN